VPRPFESLLSRIRSPKPPQKFLTPPEGLSLREMDCLRLVALGYSDQGVADALGISRSTARQLVEGGRRKLKAKTRAHLAALSVSLGIVEGS
jgi:LuxR family transcriptional regulator, quorum-sensing system regulator BjaR1